jgi:hypothetical protein
MIGMKSLTRDIRNLATDQGWEEDEMLAYLADFVTQNNLDDELPEFLQEEAEKLGSSLLDEHDEDDIDNND